VKKPNEKAADALNDHARKLVAAFIAKGPEALKGMNLGEVSLLLSEQQSHLNQVSERCNKGQGLFVNVPLKRLLGKNVQTVEAEIRNRDLEMER